MIKNRKKPTLSIAGAEQQLTLALTTGDNHRSFKVESYTQRRSLLLYVHPRYPFITLLDAVKVVESFTKKPAWKRFKVELSVCIEGISKEKFQRAMGSVSDESKIAPWRWYHDGQCVYLKPRSNFVQFSEDHCKLLNHGLDVKLHRISEGFSLCIEMDALMK